MAVKMKRQQQQQEIEWLRWEISKKRRRGVRQETEAVEEEEEKEERDMRDKEMKGERKYSCHNHTPKKNQPTSFYCTIFLTTVQKWKPKSIFLKEKYKSRFWYIESQICKEVKYSENPSTKTAFDSNWNRLASFT